MLALVVGAAACGRKSDNEPAVATPSLTLSRSKAALGSPLELTYRFAVAASAPHLGQKYRVMVHFVDADDELMWTEDHDPQVPTTEWKPGQTVEYTRTSFIPVYPYVGEASIQVGLYAAGSGERLKLGGDDSGQRAYRVAKLQLLPQTENIFLVFKDGWHPSETAQTNSTVDWQWTKKEATISFRNPRRDSIFYLHLDSPGNVFQEQQTVDVVLGDQPLDHFTLAPKQELIRKIKLSSAQLGSNDMAEVKIVVDKTFVPGLLSPAFSRDTRELGVRVFHAFIDPQ